MEDERFIKILNPAYWYEGETYGYAHTAKGCKICNCEPRHRDMIEMLLRNPEAKYRDVIDFDDQSIGSLNLNKCNLSLHKNKHMRDDLVDVRVEPDHLGPGLLLPRSLIKQIPHSNNKAGELCISKCSLLGCCEWLELEGTKAFCSYRGGCPAREKNNVR